MFEKKIEIKKVQYVCNTNNAVRDLIEEGKCIALIAENIDYGKSRKGRDWAIYKGNLHMSIGILLKEKADLNHVVFLVALAIGDCLKGCNIRYKWPNDIFIDKKKVSGILIEREGEKLVIGIGVNIKGCPDYAACIPAEMQKNPENLAEEIIHSLKKLEANLDSFDKIKNEWEKKAMFLNQSITFDNGAKSVFGKFTGIDNLGRLKLKSSDQELNFFSSGSICMDT